MIPDFEIATTRIIVTCLVIALEFLSFTGADAAPMPQGYPSADPSAVQTFENLVANGEIETAIVEYQNVLLSANVPGEFYLRRLLELDHNKERRKSIAAVATSYLCDPKLYKVTSPKACQKELRDAVKAGPLSRNQNIARAKEILSSYGMTSTPPVSTAPAPVPQVSSNAARGGDDCRVVPPKCQALNAKGESYLQQMMAGAGPASILAPATKMLCATMFGVTLNNMCAQEYEQQGRSHCADVARRQAAEDQRAASQAGDITGMVSLSGLRATCAFGG